MDVEFGCKTSCWGYGSNKISYVHFQVRVQKLLGRGVRGCGGLYPTRLADLVDETEIAAGIVFRDYSFTHGGAK